MRLGLRSFDNRLRMDRRIGELSHNEPNVTSLSRSPYDILGGAAVAVIGRVGHRNRPARTDAVRSTARTKQTMRAAQSLESKLPTPQETFRLAKIRPRHISTGNDCQGQRAVIDEQSDQHLESGGQHGHGKACALARRVRTTAASATIRNRAANAGIAKSSPGHGTPSPSPVQNTPNAESMTPTQT